MAPKYIDIWISEMCEYVTFQDKKGLTKLKIFGSKDCARLSCNHKGP